MGQSHPRMGIINSKCIGQDMGTASGGYCLVSRPPALLDDRAELLQLAFRTQKRAQLQ